MSTAASLNPALLDDIALLSSQLPPLPAIIRYYDDFSNETQTIRDISAADEVTFYLDGSKSKFKFSALGPVETISKHVIIDWLDRLDPTTTTIRIAHILGYISRHGIEPLAHLVVSNPYDAQAYWNKNILSTATAMEAWALKAMLYSLCRLHVGAWALSMASIVKGLLSPKYDQYRVVRAGECFLPLDQQSRIVDYIDEALAVVLNEPEALSDIHLRDVCILIMSFQYAFRPGQIARIELADVRVYSTGAVHVAVKLIKQPQKSNRIRVTRRIKREWGPLFVELLKRRESGRMQCGKGVPPRLLFGLTPSAVSHSITSVNEGLTGEPWTPTALRHTAAQRLADGGISHVGLSDFMGHTSDRTANVYFDTSPSQAQRVNEALAISPIYSAVAKVAKTKTIDKAALLGLPSDQQIGAVPHGIPIAGIGGCGLGQSLCTKNPVLACYTCSRFMPLGEPEIHEEVLESLRPIVTEFAAAARNNQQSPAYAQLRGVIDAVRRVVEELKAETAEVVST